MEITATFEAVLEKENKKDSNCNDCDLPDICNKYNNQKLMECYKDNYIYKIKWKLKK